MGFLKQHLVQGKNLLIIYHSMVVPTINLVNQYKCKSLSNSATRRGKILESSKINKESPNNQTVRIAPPTINRLHSHLKRHQLSLQHFIQKTNSIISKKVQFYFNSKCHMSTYNHDKLTYNTRHIRKVRAVSLYLNIGRSEQSCTHAAPSIECLRSH